MQLGNPLKEVYFQHHTVSKLQVRTEAISVFYFLNFIYFYMFGFTVFGADSLLLYCFEIAPVYRA